MNQEAKMVRECNNERVCSLLQHLSKGVTKNTGKVLPGLLAVFSVLPSVTVKADVQRTNVTTKADASAMAKQIVTGLPADLLDAAKTAGLLQKWKTGHTNGSDVSVDSSRFAEKLSFAGSHLRQSQVDRLLPIEGDSFEAKLLLIAWDKRWNKERYQEVEREYIYKVDNPDYRLPSSPSLRAKHAAEAYRLPWEHTLLRPNVGYPEGYDKRATEALAIIHNTASLVTLIEYFRAAAVQPVGPRQLSYEIVRPEALVLDALVAFQDSEAGKTALRTCLALGAEQQARHESAMLAKGIHETPEDLHEWSVARHARGLGLKVDNQQL